MHDHHAYDRGERAEVARRWLGAAAAAWALIFAVRGVYWSLGGRVGLGTLSPQLQQVARDGDPAVALALWIATVALFGAAAVTAVLALPAHRRPGLLGRPALVVCMAGLCLAGAALLALQGLGYVTLPLRVDWTATVRWYALLWGPWFLLGGVLVGGTGALALRGTVPSRPSM